MKTSLPEGVHTYAGRLTSFSITYRLPRKSRTSSANPKSQIVLAWPHERPSPEQLARAGFYYRPSPESPDSVECFLCRKGLNGWEEEDNPIEEHLKHSADCGWAVNVYIEQKSEEQKRDDGDPLSESMMTARRATFADSWPHEGKKGWLCKVTKMIEAGWYHCPSPDSDDFVSCAYCGLSLDGWEPKDNPMEEHKRRSPMCPFFTTTTLPTARGKTAKVKKGRASKLSLVSTQSANWTTFSGNSSFAGDVVEEGDSIMSTATRLAAKGKKAVTARGRNTRAKKNEQTELSSFMEPEDDSFDVKVSEKPTRTTRGKKRSSAEMNADDHKDERQGSVDTVTEAPPAKRRTRTRSSLAQVQNFPVAAPVVAPRYVTMIDADDAPPAATKKGAKGRRTRSSTAKPRGGRKISAASTASVASMRMEIDIPDDDEIDRALEADLDRPLTDNEADGIEAEEVSKKTRLTRTRVPSAKAVASVAPVRKGTRASKRIDEDVEMSEAADAMASDVQPEPEISQPKVTAPKGKQTRKASAKQKPGPRSKPNAVEETHSMVQASIQGEAQTQERVDQQSLLDSSILGDVTSPPPITRPKRAISRKPSRQIEKRNTRANVTSTTDSHTLPSSETDHPLDGGSNSGYESVDSMASQATVRRGGGKQQGTVEKRGKGVKNGATGSRHIEEFGQRHAETASKSEKDGAIEEGRPKRGKKVDTNANARKVMDSQIDIDKAGASTEPTTQTARPPPDIPTVKAAKGKGARKATAVEKSNSTPSNEAMQVEACANAPARDEPILEFAAPAHLHQSKAVKGKASASAKAKVTPSSSETISAPSVDENQQRQQGQREERQQVTPDPSNASDAENQPPSSRPSVSTPFRSHATRIPLATSTPTASSPFKRNVVAGLQTSFPWSMVDLEAVFLPSPTPTRQGAEHGDTDKENRSIRMPLNLMKGLTSPEKKMTVGEWIWFNAKREEEKLRAECERLVGIFEREGNRAMKVLEGIEVAD